MDCPKCSAATPMKELTLDTLKGDVVVDRCTNCKGIWFDLGELEALKEKWGTEYIDSGDPKVGKSQNKIRDINCPRCAENGVEKCMQLMSDKSQIHIEYEVCEQHGIYLDAGEFEDLKHHTPMDLYRDLIYVILRWFDFLRSSAQKSG